MRQPEASPTRLSQNSRDQARLRAMKAPGEHRPPRPAAQCMIRYGDRRRGDLGPKNRDEAKARGVRAFALVAKSIPHAGAPPPLRPPPPAYEMLCHVPSQGTTA